MTYVWNRKIPLEVLSKHFKQCTWEVSEFGWTILSLLLSVIRRHLTPDPLSFCHTHTHIYGPFPLYAGKTLRQAKQELFLKAPLPTHTHRNSCTSSVPVPFLSLWCSVTPSSWRRCSVMCPSRASNVVTGLGTTGLHWLWNAAALNIWTCRNAPWEKKRGTRCLCYVPGLVNNEHTPIHTTAKRCCFDAF